MKNDFSADFFLNKDLHVKQYIKKKIIHSTALLRGDYDVCELIKSSKTELTKAAVLIPIVQKDTGLSIIFTKRKKNLKNHAGQISFPGGKQDKEDSSLKETALREAEEEIGLKKLEVEMLGRIGNWETRTGFLIAPYVGFLSRIPKLKKNISEVDEIFEVPLSFLLDPKNQKLENKIFSDREYQFYAIKYCEYYIWGATAGIIMNLYHTLR